MIQVDDKVFRGPRPQSISDLQGIKFLLDLESGIYDYFHPSAVKAYIKISKSITEYDVPLGDIFPPTEWELNGCLGIMTRATKEFPIYVHCRWGKDRTGLVCAYYRVKVNGWTVDKAIHEMFDLGFHKFPYSYLGWVRALRGYLG